MPSLRYNSGATEEEVRDRWQDYWRSSLAAPCPRVSDVSESCRGKWILGSKGESWEKTDRPITKN